MGQNKTKNCHEVTWTLSSLMPTWTRGQGRRQPPGWGVGVAGGRKVQWRRGRDVCDLRKSRKKEVREVSRSPTLGKWSSTPGSISGKYIGRRGSDSPTTTVLFPGLSSKHVISDKQWQWFAPKKIPHCCQQISVNRSGQLVDICQNEKWKNTFDFHQAPR